MELKSINRGDPEQVFISVYNGATSKMTVGYCAFWDYNPTLSATLFGVQVTVPVTTIANNKGRAAGIVARRDIEAGAHGMLQVYGYHSAVRLTGNTVSPLAAGLATADTAEFDNAGAILIPANNATTGGVAGYGYMGLALAQVITGTNTVLLPIADVHLLPWANLIDVNGTTGATIATDGTGTAKAFLHFI